MIIQKRGNKLRSASEQMEFTRIDGSKAADNKGLKEMAGEVVNQTFVHLINSCGRLTVRASKPPLL